MCFFKIDEAEPFVAICGDLGWSKSMLSLVDSHHDQLPERLYKAIDSSG